MPARELLLRTEAYAFGGSVVGRDEKGRPVFVQGALPGEYVRVALTVDKDRFAHAYVVEVLEPATARTVPRCPHFGPCGGCSYQHVIYEEQLRAKWAVTEDQLQRIGGLSGIEIVPVIPSPQGWEYAREAVFSPASDSRLGYWSPRERQVIPIETCPITHPRIMALFNDIDLDLPELRKLRLRLDSEEAMLAAMEIDRVEPPELAVNFPISVAIVLPDQRAASLIGEPYLLYEVKNRVFRVSPGCFFHANLPMAAKLVETVLDFAALQGDEQVLELYSGAGLLTAFLAQEAADVAAVEANDDAVADLAVNLQELDNVTLFHGPVEEVLPDMAGQLDVMVVDPGPDGLDKHVIEHIVRLEPAHLIHVGSDLAHTARDARALQDAGFELLRVQPLDMWPQTYRVDTVCLWRNRES